MLGKEGTDSSGSGVHDLPDFVRFTHKRHVLAGVALPRRVMATWRGWMPLFRPGAVDDGVVLELPRRAQRADGLSGMSPLGKLKVESGKWKVRLGRGTGLKTLFTFNEHLLLHFHVRL